MPGSTLLAIFTLFLLSQYMASPPAKSIELERCCHYVLYGFGGGLGDTKGGEKSPGARACGGKGDVGARSLRTGRSFDWPALIACSR